MAYFPWLSLGATAAVVLLALARRGRFYAVFAGIFLTIHTLLSSALAPEAERLFPKMPVAAWVYVYLQATVYLHFGSLSSPRLRPVWFRALVSIPASYFAAATFLAFPWVIARAVGLPPYGWFVPHLFATIGVVQSLWQRFEERDVTLDGETLSRLSRRAPGDGRVERPLRVVQITDPHLGPFMSEARLRDIAARAAAANPDLVLLTGDFVTMESHEARAPLARALSPLRSLEGRVFACFGNHDHEAPRIVAGALRDIGARLLLDEDALVDTPAGRVQILGLDFHFRDRARRIREVCAAHPRRTGALRLVLLHDPGAFKHLPDGDADLVFSGHTHGGQLGLLILGLPHTVVSAFTRIPDHGFWGLGTNRLYVHRGTGHYGFPLRLGVPGEESLVRIHPMAREPRPEPPAA